jgi:hypothetical protein
MVSNRAGVSRRGWHGVGMVVVAAVLVATISCGSSGRTDTGTGATTSAMPATTTTTPTGSTGSTGDGIDPMDGADTATKTGSGSGQGVAFLTDVQVARHEGYDRVVFTFSNHTPGYQVGYIPKPVKADGSGEDVAVDGNYVVGVRMDPASGVDLSATSEPQGYKETYLGPKRINQGTPEVTEVVESGDFEAVLN